MSVNVLIELVIQCLREKPTTELERQQAAAAAENSPYSESSFGRDIEKQQKNEQQPHGNTFKLISFPVSMARHNSENFWRRSAVFSIVRGCAV
jgi:hypothetical protein